MKTLGTKPTLSEILEYYDREDVKSFIYQACLDRKILLFFAPELRWSENLRGTFLTLDNPECLSNAILKSLGDSLDELAEDEPMKFYPSFHAVLDMLDDYKDFALEADMRGWRRSFDDLYGALEILDRFQVAYRIKFSGHRSLHLMIPWEAFPESFNGLSVKDQWRHVCDRIRAYFVLHGGLKSAHRPGGILRIAYSLNENTGLVSLPIARDGLEDFRPWEASMYHTKIDQPWFGHMPEDAKQNTIQFLTEVFADKGVRHSSSPIAGIKIIPKDMTDYAKRLHPSNAAPERNIKDIYHGDPAVRAQAAWNIMAGNFDIPMDIVSDGLKDEDNTVRWFLSETLHRKIGQGSALELAFKLLSDKDEYVRVNAADFIIQFYQATPSFSVKSLMESSNNSDVMAYIIRKVCAENQSAVESILQDLMDYIVKVEEASALARVFTLLNSLLSTQPAKKMLLYLLKIMSFNKVSRDSIRILEQFWPNDAFTRTLCLRLASSLGIKLPQTRVLKVSADEMGEIMGLVTVILEEATRAGKINMLAAMLLYGRKPTRVAAARLIRIVGAEAVEPIIAGIKLSGGLSLILSASMVAEVLKEIEPDPVTSVLRPLRSEDIGVQQNALLVLRALGMRKAVKPLVEMLKDRRVNLRVFVVRALGGIRGKNATSGLIGALKDRNRLVRMEAIQELKKRIDSPGVREAIIKCRNDRSKHVRQLCSIPDRV